MNPCTCGHEVELHEDETGACTGMVDRRGNPCAPGTLGAEACSCLAYDEYNEDAPDTEDD